MGEELDLSFEHSITGEQLLSGTGQLGRLAWLGKRLRTDDLYFLQDGEFSKLLVHETVQSFVNGQFISTIVLGFSLIERTIAGRLSFIGETATRLTSEQLIKKGFEKNWLSASERDHINALRALRNPIVHFRDPLDETRPEIKAILAAKTQEQMLESDAKQMLKTAIRVLGKTAL